MTIYGRGDDGADKKKSRADTDRVCRWAAEVADGWMEDG